MSKDGQGTKCRRNIAENYNRLSRVHERYRRQTTDRQTDERQLLCSTYLALWPTDNFVHVNSTLRVIRRLFGRDVHVSV